VSRRLAEELDQVREPAVLPTQLGTLDWFEVVRQSGQGLSASSSRIMEAWNAPGQRVKGHAIAGEPFWTTTEIVTSPELIERTVDVMTSDVSIARGIQE
jgi:hypothetical protein